jgi:hypothetical protein
MPLSCRSSAMPVSLWSGRPGVRVRLRCGHLRLPVRARQKVRNGRQHDLRLDRVSPAPPMEAVARPFRRSGQAGHPEPGGQLARAPSQGPRRPHPAPPYQDPPGCREFFSSRESFRDPSPHKAPRSENAPGSFPPSGTRSGLPAPGRAAIAGQGREQARRDKTPGMAVKRPGPCPLAAGSSRLYGDRTGRVRLDAPSNRLAEGRTGAGARTQGAARRVRASPGPEAYATSSIRGPVAHDDVRPVDSPATSNASASPRYR